MHTIQRQTLYYSNLYYHINRKNRNFNEQTSAKLIYFDIIVGENIRFYIRKIMFFRVWLIAGGLMLEVASFSKSFLSCEKIDSILE